jgi:two-component system chemotaxis response regulator CheY
MAKKIMIIDDSATVRKYHIKLLSKFTDLSIEEAHDGMDALEKSIQTTSTIMLFLVDVEMPTMDGYAFAKEIRKVNRYKKTPIIMVTGKDTEESKRVAFESGANLYNLKPMKPKILETYIKLFVLKG